MRPTLRSTRVAYTAIMPAIAPWVTPMSSTEPTPVGTTLASSRSEMCSVSSRLGATAASESDTGATANEVMIAASA